MFFVLKNNHLGGGIFVKFFFYCSTLCSILTNTTVLFFPLVFFSFLCFFLCSFFPFPFFLFVFSFVLATAHHHPHHRHHRSRHALSPSVTASRSVSVSLSASRSVSISLSPHPVLSLCLWVPPSQYSRSLSLAFAPS